MENKYFLSPPSQQKFYNNMAFLLTLTTLNSNFWVFFKMPKHCLYSFQRGLIFYIVPTAMVSQVLFLFINYRHLEFNTLAMIYTVLPVNFIMIVKICIARTASYKKAMTEFLQEIHVSAHYCKNKTDVYVGDILIRAEKYTRLSFYVLALLCFICTLSFLIVPIFHNIQENSSIYNITTRLEIMVHFWLPIDYEFNFFIWCFMEVVVTYCVTLCVSVIIMFDIINLAFLYHLTGHIQIFKYILKNDFNAKLFEEEIKGKLIEVSQYYNFIRRIFKDVESAFGFNIIGIYLHNLIGGGLLLYQILTSGADTGTLLSYGLMIPIYMGELIILSLVLEEIRIQSNEIPELVYGLRWENMSLSNQRLVQMILFQVQPVLEFRAAFNVRTGVQPAMTIIKTTFSYYVMIKSRM